MGGETIVNTPGVYYALAYWLSTNLIIWNSPKRITLGKRILVQVIFLVLLVTIMAASDGVVVLFVPLMFLYMLMIFLSIYINCAYDEKTAIYFAVRAFMIGEFTASLEWQVAYYAISATFLPNTVWTELIILAAVHGVAFFLLYLLEKRHREVNKNIAIHTRELVSALVIGIAVFAVSNMSYVIGGSLFSSQFAQEIFIIRTLVDLGGVAILFAYHSQLGELNIRLELQKLQDMLNMQYGNYEMLERSIGVVNQKYHDLKYQIALLKQETEAEESIAYLDQLEQEIKIYEAQNKTGNKILDTILTGKSIYCQNHWIELTCVVDGTAIAFMEAMDISTLFGNMLDNAIESVSKIEKKERRLIHLAVARQKGFVRIRIENCYDEALVFDNGMPVSTKADKKYHGFGLKSIQSTAKKYGGSATIQAENGWFELRILMPYPEE